MDELSGFEDLASALSQGMGQRKLYYAGHPCVRSCAESCAERLNALLVEAGKECLFLGLVEENLVHEGRTLIGPTILGSRLITLMENLGSGGLLFWQGVSAEEIAEAFDLSVELKSPCASYKDGRGILRSRGVQKIEISPPYEDAGWFGQFLFEGDGGWSGEALEESGGKEMVGVYQSLFDTVEVAHGRAASDSGVDLAGARSVSERLIQATDGNFTDILPLVRYPDYDSFTIGHSVRVSLLAVLVGHHLGASQAFLVELGTAGLLHDVGKACVPDEILYKPSQLDSEERRVMAGHSVQGAKILLESGDAGPLAIGAAWGHHLRRDGRGYPARPPWELTSQATRLLHVCDVFEAITAIRPYQQPRPPRRALEIMLREREAFDPGAFSAFVAAVGLYPPGSRVQLSDGAQGLVVAAGEAIDRPRVRLTCDAAGQPLSGGDRPLIDLAETEALSVATLIGESPRPAA